MNSNWETAFGPARRKILSTRRILKIGTWNIRTLFQAGKANIVANEMVRYGLEILGLSEVRWDNFGETLLQSGHKIIYSGNASDQPNHTQGVAFLLSNEAPKSLLSWEPHGPRIIEATFKTSEKKINMRIIQVYSPTNEATDEDKDSFYDQLETVYIKNYREGKGVSLRVKVVGICFLWLTIGYSIICVVESLVLQIVLGLIALGVSCHILSLKTMRH